MNMTIVIAVDHELIIMYQNETIGILVDSPVTPLLQKRSGEGVVLPHQSYAAQFTIDYGHPRPPIKSGRTLREIGVDGMRAVTDRTTPTPRMSGVSQIRDTAWRSVPLAGKSVIF